MSERRFDSQRSALPLDVILVVGADRPSLMRVWCGRGAKLLVKPATLAWIGFVLALVTLYGQVGAASQEAVYPWFNADALFPVHVYKDVVTDDFPLSGWKLPMAPWVFPDIPLACLCMMITGHAAVANFLFGSIQVALLTLGTCVCCRSIGLRPAHLFSTCIVAGATALVLVTAVYGATPHPLLALLFTPQTHAGTLATAIWAAACCFRLFREESSGWQRRLILGCLAALCMLGTMSDMFFVLYLTLPLSAAVIVGIYGGLIPARKSLSPLAACWLASLAGGKLAPALFNMHDLLAPARGDLNHVMIALRLWIESVWSAHVVAPSMLHWAGTLWTVFCAAALLAAVRIKLRPLPSLGNLAEPWSLAAVFVGFLALAGILPWIAVVATGHNFLSVDRNYLAAMRYAPALLFVPFVGWPMALAAIGANWRFAVQSQWLSRSMGGASLIVSLIILSRYSPKAGSLYDYYPPLVQFLDEHAAEHKLSYGVTGFWTARDLTLFSKTGLRSYQFQSDLKPFIWLGNRHWYTQRIYGAAPPPPFNFLITDQWITASTAIARFGEPAETLNFGAHQVLIYNRPEDDEFRNVALDWHVPGYRRKFRAEALFSQTGVLEGAARVAREGTTGAGYLAFGPYVKLPAGDYKLRLNLDPQAGSDPVGTWQAGYFEDPRLTLASGEIRAGTGGVETTIQAVEGREFVMRVFYSGRGNLAVRELTITRMR